MEEKADNFEIDHGNAFQIYNDVAIIRLEFTQFPQLGYRQFFDSATQEEDCESPSRYSLNSKSHGSGHLTDIEVTAVLHGIPSMQAPTTSTASEYPIGFH